jgi:hypothetical protein
VLAASPRADCLQQTGGHALPTCADVSGRVRRRGRAMPVAATTDARCCMARWQRDRPRSTAPVCAHGLHGLGPRGSPSTVCAAPGPPVLETRRATPECGGPLDRYLSEPLVYSGRWLRPGRTRRHRERMHAANLCPFNLLPIILMGRLPMPAAVCRQRLTAVVPPHASHLRRI